MTTATSRMTFLSPDSAVVLTATEILETHSTGSERSASEVRCQRCGMLYPCPPAVNAQQVLAAAGLFDGVPAIAGARTASVTITSTDRTSGPTAAATAAAPVANDIAEHAVKSTKSTRRGARQRPETRNAKRHAIAS